MSELPILIACEYSNTVAQAFRDRGFETYSCDLRASEGPTRWHIQDDIRNHLQAGRWAAAICHPYCTFNTLAGIRWMYHPEDTALPQPDRRRHPKYPNRMRDFLEGALLFADLMAAPIEFVACENSKPHGLAMRYLAGLSRRSSHGTSAVRLPRAQRSGLSASLSWCPRTRRPRSWRSTEKLWRDAI